MRQIQYPIFVTFLLILAACSSPVASESTSTVLPLSTTTAVPVPTETSIPSTPTLEPAATATVIPTPAMPDYAQAFIDAGYDKKSTDSDFYVIYDESSIHYLPGDGIIFNERIIRSWAEVDYLENSVWKRGKVINFVARGGIGLFKDYGKFIWASSIGPGVDHASLQFLQNTNNDYNEHFDDGGHPILHTSLTKYPQTGEAALFEGIFPKVDGKLQPVNIPGIGIVLPFCELRNPEFPIY